MKWLSIVLTVFLIPAAQADLFSAHSDSSPKYCEKPIRPPIKNSSDCPFPPRRKNGGKCFNASPDVLENHTSGYKDYVIDLIDKAIEKTTVFSKNGVELPVLMSVLAKESWYNPMSTNSWGDIGISQFQPSTAQATLDYMKALGMQVPDKINTKLPPGCSANSYNTPLSKKCFKSIKKNCETEPFSRSLYCPNFALQLMAFHFLQIKERQVSIEHKNKEYNVSLLLAPSGDPEAEIRHLASVYNRGFRIYTSAYHSFLKTKEWPTANRYGNLWQANRSIPREKDPFPGGNLRGHYINRCYVWAITGICGGIAGSTVAKHIKMLCPNRFQHEVVPSNSSLAYQKGHLNQALSFLLSEASEDRKLSDKIWKKKIELAISLYEGGANFSTNQLLDFLSRVEKQGLQASATQITFRELKNAYSFYKRNKKVSDVKEQLRRLLEIPVEKSYKTTQRRYAGLKALRSYAKRQKPTSLEDEKEWLYLTGVAGFYLHNSGHKDLKKYMDLCRGHKKEGACKYRNHARKLWWLGLGVVGDKSHLEE